MYLSESVDGKQEILKYFSDLLSEVAKGEGPGSTNAVYYLDHIMSVLPDDLRENLINYYNRGKSQEHQIQYSGLGNLDFGGGSTAMPRRHLRFPTFQEIAKVIPKKTKLKEVSKNTSK